MSDNVITVADALALWAVRVEEAGLTNLLEGLSVKSMLLTLSTRGYLCRDMSTPNWDTVFLPGTPRALRQLSAAREDYEGAITGLRIAGDEDDGFYAVPMTPERHRRKLEGFVSALNAEPRDDSAAVEAYFATRTPRLRYDAANHRLYPSTAACVARLAVFVVR